MLFLNGIANFCKTVQKRVAEGFEKVKKGRPVQRGSHLNFKGYEFWKVFNSNILNKWSFFSGKYCDCQCQIEINVCNNCNLCSYKFISKMPFSYSGLTMIFLVSIQVQKLQMNSLSMFEKVKLLTFFL